MQYSTFALHRIFTGYLSSEITTVTLSPEGLLAVASSNGKIFLADVQRFQPLAFATLPETAHATTCIWRKSSFVFATSDGMVASSAFHRDSEKISSNIIREIAIDKLLQFASSVQWVPYIDPRAAVECLAAHVESGQIAIATDNSVEVWRLRSGQDRYEFIRRLVAPQPVQGAKFSYLAFLDKTQLLGWRRHGPLMFWSVALGTSYAIDGLAASTKVLATFKHYLSTAGDDGVRLYNLQGSGLRLLHKVEVKDYVGGATAFDMVGNSNCILVAYARKSGGLCLINFPLKLTQTPTVIVSTDGAPIIEHLAVGASGQDILIAGLVRSPNNAHTCDFDVQIWSTSPFLKGTVTYTANDDIPVINVYDMLVDSFKATMSIHLQMKWAWRRILGVVWAGRHFVVKILRHTFTFSIIVLIGALLLTVLAFNPTSSDHQVSIPAMAGVPPLHVSLLHLLARRLGWMTLRIYWVIKRLGLAFSALYEGSCDVLEVASHNGGLKVLEVAIHLCMGVPEFVEAGLCDRLEAKKP